MRAATEEKPKQEPVRVGNPNPRLGGTDIFRGALVIVTALVIGGFVISRGIDSGGSTESASSEAAEIETSNDSESAELGSESEDTGDVADPDGVTSSSTVVDQDGSLTPADSSTDTTIDDGATTEVMPEETVPEAPALRSPAEVKVLVLNGAKTQGIAARGTETLLAASYKTGAPKNATTQRPSSILYNEGFEAEALEVAAVFGIGLEGLVAPYDPADPPIDDTQEADVIVVIGADQLIPIS